MDIGNIGHDVQPLRRAPGVRLHRAAGMAGAAVVLMLVFNAANLPSPLYVIYRQRLHFSEIMLALIFAVYVVGSLTALIFFGRLSDQIGRRPVLFGAMALAAASMLVFVFAADIAMLFVARTLSGFAMGLVAAACTAWIAELAPEDAKAAAAPMASGAGVAALGLGPLISGVLAQYTSWPLVLPYLVYLVGLAPPAYVVWTIRETVRSPTPLGQVSLRPRLGVPAEILPQFAGPAMSAFVAFALMGFYSSLIPNVLQRSLHIQNHATGGAIIFFMFACGLAAIVILRRIDSRVAVFTALALLVPGVLILTWAESAGSLHLLLAASAIGGVSGALGYCSSLQRINEMSPRDRRAEVVATLLVACYAGISLPIIGTGILAQLLNPHLADFVFALVLCGLAILAAAIGTIFGARAND